MRTVPGMVVLAGMLASCGVDADDGATPIMETNDELHLEVGGEPLPLGGGAEECPTSSSHRAEIDYWTRAHAGNAVTVCKGWDCLLWIGETCVADKLVATVQIVNFEAGAKMRVVSEVFPGVPAGQHHTELVKRTAQGWYDWTKDHISWPPAGRLFSVTNGSFFMCNYWLRGGCTNSLGISSAMSFPQKASNTITSAGAETGERVLRDGTSAKRLFALGDPRRRGGQISTILTYDHAGQSDAKTVEKELAPFFDATVGFHPDFDPHGEEYRTVIGVRDMGEGENGTYERAYLLTSETTITAIDANGILVEDFGAMVTMQLDSGGSTQFYACESGCSSSKYYRDSFDTFDWWWFGPRPIPEVLAIYDAP